MHRKDLAGPGYVCISGLWILYGLQVWWFSLILKMAYKIFIKGEEWEDIRVKMMRIDKVKKKQQKFSRITDLFFMLMFLQLCSLPGEKI